MNQRSRIAILTYMAVMAISVFWVAGIVAAPLLSGSPSHWCSKAAGLLYFIYGRACHQIPDRSFHIEGHQFGVCVRCFALYGGYLAGLASYCLLRPVASEENPPRKWLILALIPAAIDFGGGWLGLFTNTAVSRTATGLIAGAAGAFYTLPGLVSLALEISGRRKDPDRNFYLVEENSNG